MGEPTIDETIEIRRGLRIDYDNQSAFRPHLTLARNAQPPEELTIAPVLWHADHVALVQSDSLDQGRQYRILASRWLRP